MNLTKRVRQTLRELDVTYRAGVHQYPRIDNNFIAASKAFDMYPHPPFSIGAGSKFHELTGETLTVNKKGSLLFLSLLRLMSPANIPNYADFIDSFFDDDLSFLNAEKEKEALRIIDELAVFMQNDEVTQQDIISEYESIFTSSKQRNFSLYKMDSLSFETEEESRIPKYIPKAIHILDGTVDENLSHKDYYTRLKKKQRLTDALREYDILKQCELSAAEEMSKQLDLALERRKGH